jgi:hypothetical protein
MGRCSAKESVVLEFVGNNWVVVAVDEPGDEGDHDIICDITNLYMISYYDIYDII